MNSVKLVLTITFTFLIHTATSKVYGRCELAKELRDIYGIPENQLATWICIIGHESSYNTSAISEGAESYGLFQISREYWCLPNGRGCGVACSALRDDDIRDDVDCAKRIFEQHQRITGDGFKAWTLYNYRCKANVEKYIRDCYEGYPGYVPRKPQPSYSAAVASGGFYQKSSYYGPKLTTYNIPPAPTQAYKKTYYKVENGFAPQPEEEEVYSYKWSWSSNGGFHLRQSGQLPSNVAEELLALRRRLEKVNSWSSG